MSFNWWIVCPCDDFYGQFDMEISQESLSNCIAQNIVTPDALSGTLYQLDMLTAAALVKLVETHIADLIAVKH
jgi:hypothetical protein